MSKVSLKLKTGQSFGCLTLINLTCTSTLKVRCRCECGREVEVYKKNLISGRTRSCGCQSKLNAAHDLTGKRYGELEALYALKDRDSSGCVMWLCECQCGTRLAVSSRRLNRGWASSCGCLQSRKLLNLRFGKLRVMRAAGYEKRTQLWECLCDCGEYKTVTQRNLISGHTKSCGCLKTQEHRLMVDGTCINVLASAKLPVDNTSGHKGVSRTARGKWVAYITLRRKRYNLGTFSTFEEAVIHRERAEAEMFEPLVKKYSNKKEVQDK